MSKYSNFDPTHFVVEPEETEQREFDEIQPIEIHAQ